MGYGLRKSTFVAVLVFAWGLGSIHSAKASDRESFCHSHSPEKIIASMDAPEMRIPFRNEGGIGNGGVCWWHSRFQRALWSIANFSPELPKPTRAQAKALVHRIANRNEVVEIPGYEDVVTFAVENQDLIQSELNRWQISDALINQAYLRGLSGISAYRNPAKLKKHMDGLYERYLAASPRGEVVWVMLQEKGIASHASLIREMLPEAGGGYSLRVVDSNFPDDYISYHYVVGDHSLTPENGYERPVSWVPYDGFSRDFTRLRGALATYCEGAPPLRLEDQG